MLSKSEKQKITERLEKYIDRYQSQNKAANSLKGVSAALISQVVNNNHNDIADDKWRTIASQIGYSPNGWEPVMTRDFKTIDKLLFDAKEHSLVMGITGEAGSGKSFAFSEFVTRHPNAYVLSCNEFWNRKYFLAALLTEMGRDYSGLTVAEMMGEVVRVLNKLEKPILILDEADKLSDQVLYFFITLYNQLEDHCALILAATDHLAKRVRKGLRLNKKGYKEIYSRLGRKFIELKGVNSSDISQICRANGITKTTQIREVVGDSEFDLRRVKRKIFALKRQAKREKVQDLEVAV